MQNIKIRSNFTLQNYNNKALSLRRQRVVAEVWKIKDSRHRRHFDGDAWGMP